MASEDNTPGGVPQGNRGPAQVKTLAEVIGVANKAFPGHADYVGSDKVLSKGGSSTAGQEALDVVGNCPKCGSPIYGKKQTLRGEPPPLVKHTCSCNLYQIK